MNVAELRAILNSINEKLAEASLIVEDTKHIEVLRAFEKLNAGAEALDIALNRLETK